MKTETLSRKLNAWSILSLELVSFMQGRITGHSFNMGNNWQFSTANVVSTIPPPYPPPRLTVIIFFTVNLILQLVRIDLRHDLYGLLMY